MHHIVGKCENLGFTLLEAMVAMVLTATVGMALFSWINVSATSTSRAIDIKNQSEIVENAVEILRQINPTLQPEGREQFGEFTMEWSSEISGEFQPNRDGGSKGFFDVGLYDVSVLIYKNNSLIDQYQTRLVGYRKVRGFDEIN